VSGFSGSPRLVKGALVNLDIFNPLASVIVFQYNPETVTRRLTASSGDGGGAQSEQLRLKGPPAETISMEIELDAADFLEVADPIAVTLGIAPALASLELMLYPKTAEVIVKTALAAAGLVEVVPPAAPLTLLVWGPTRVLPVRLTELSITEEAFDTVLNPTRAKVSISLRVLSYDDLGLASPGGALYLAQQVAKEAMATVNSITAIGSFSGSANLGASG
jgi:hypothetical protein